MKTVIDTVNKFKGEYPFPDELYCSVKEFNKCVEEMTTNYGRYTQSYADYKFDFHLPPETPPIYTKEMVDAGVMPLVGMECMILDDSLMNCEYEKCSVLFIGIYKVVYTSESCVERFSILEDIIFKPLDTRTDTEKAIDNLMFFGDQGQNKDGANFNIEAIKAGKIHGVTWSGK